MDFNVFDAMQAAGVIAFAFYWFLRLFALTLIELVCKEIKAMLKQMLCEIHTKLFGLLECCDGVSVSVLFLNYLMYIHNHTTLKASFYTVLKSCGSTTVFALLYVNREQKMN